MTVPSSSIIEILLSKLPMSRLLLRLPVGVKRTRHLRSSGTVDARRQTAPATTGEATDVPDRLLQPPCILLPMTSRPYATTSGCTTARHAVSVNALWHAEVHLQA